MSFNFGPQRIEKIEKKKNIFKEYVKNLLYDNIINRILLLVIDEYNDIKNDLKTQFKYYKYMKENNSHDHDEIDNDDEDEKYDDDGYNGYDGYDEVKNPKNIMVYQQLIKNLINYYDMVIQNESIICLWDLVGLFIDCSSLFTNRSVGKIGAYSCSDLKHTGPTPLFIKTDYRFYDIIVSFVKVSFVKLDISFNISLMDQKDTAFCKIIRMVAIDLFSKIYEGFHEKPLLFNDQKFVIEGTKPTCKFNGFNLFLQIKLTC